MSHEALECFQSLLECMPTWLADIEKIAQDAKQMQDAMLAELCEVQPAVTKRRKSVSVCSIAEVEKVQLSSPAPTVFFDGDTQKAIEGLVRAVGTSRNKIRKGKLSARLDGLSRSDSSSSNNSSVGEETIKGLGTFTYRSTTTMHRSSRGDRDVELYHRVDNALEEAQAQCEKAAHQLLRTGSCELGRARKQLLVANDAVHAALPALLRQAERRRPQEVVKIPLGQSESLSVPTDKLEVDTDATEDSESEEFDLTTAKLSTKYAVQWNNRMASSFAVH